VDSSDDVHEDEDVGGDGTVKGKGDVRLIMTIVFSEHIVTIRHF
jgi:mRNA-degrading endonuclease RelE of RelBE toxin-antitoxin system